MTTITSSEELRVAAATETSSIKMATSFCATLFLSLSAEERSAFGEAYFISFESGGSTTFLRMTRGEYYEGYAARMCGY